MEFRLLTLKHLQKWMDRAFDFALGLGALNRDQRPKNIVLSGMVGAGMVGMVPEHCRE
jgi:hypothetical protein